MRAPFQILAIPYKYENGMPIYCVLHRSDYDQWQFIAGGGEDKESPNDAAKREIMEEGGINANNIISLKSMCYIPVEIFPRRHLYGWSDDMYVVPEYSSDLNVTTILFYLMNIQNLFGSHTKKQEKDCNGILTRLLYMN